MDDDGQSISGASAGLLDFMGGLQNAQNIEQFELPGAHLEHVKNDLQLECENAVLSCFPDMCPDHLNELAAQYQWGHAQLITAVLDSLEKGISYPKRAKSLKRKRDVEEKKDDSGDAEKRFENRAPGDLINHDFNYQSLYRKATKTLLMAEFPFIYAQDLHKVLKEKNDYLFQTYIALDIAYADGEASSPYESKKVPTKPLDIELEFLRNGWHPAHKDAIAEFHAAQKICEDKAAIRADKNRQEQEELDNINRAKAEGTMSECGCCFEEFPLNRMVHCNGDELHWFCRGCAKRMAETEVGLSKYHLACMSMDGCTGDFSQDQREIFLTKNLAVALERIEQEAILRMAGIENLETCPFCPYAAEYPPVKENKEFKCDNPECEVVSCRLCRQVTHIPKTCEEVAREAGHSARRQIEEAMSKAMIRTCNKCNTPFIKEVGCNKMKCTRNGCKNVQCYICSKSCDYAHFDDKTRGGRAGNCPLFDSVEKRHADEVRAAEEEARKQATEKNPGVDAELFEIKFSDAVLEDEKRRQNSGRAAAVIPPHNIIHHPYVVVPPPVPPQAPVQRAQPVHPIIGAASIPPLPHVYHHRPVPEAPPPPRIAGEFEHLQNFHNPAVHHVPRRHQVQQPVPQVQHIAQQQGQHVAQHVKDIHQQVREHIRRQVRDDWALQNAMRMAEAVRARQRPEIVQRRFGQALVALPPGERHGAVVDHLEAGRPEALRPPAGLDQLAPLQDMSEILDGRINGLGPPLDNGGHGRWAHTIPHAARHAAQLNPANHLSFVGLPPLQNHLGMNPANPFGPFLPQHEPGNAGNARQRNGVGDLADGRGPGDFDVVDLTGDGVGSQPRYASPYQRNLFKTGRSYQVASPGNDMRPGNVGGAA